MSEHKIDEQLRRISRAIVETSPEPPPLPLGLAPPRSKRASGWGIAVAFAVGLATLVSLALWRQGADAPAGSGDGLRWDWIIEHSEPTIDENLRVAGLSGTPVPTFDYTSLGVEQRLISEISDGPAFDLSVIGAVTGSGEYPGRYLPPAVYVGTVADDGGGVGVDRRYPVSAYLYRSVDEGLGATLLCLAVSYDGIGMGCRAPGEPAGTDGIISGLNGPLSKPVVDLWLPRNTAVAVLTLDDGRSFMQRPVAGVAIFVLEDIGDAGIASAEALDASGQVIVYEDFRAYWEATKASENTVSVWTRVDPDNELGGPGYQVMQEVASGGPGFVAVGAASLPGEDLDGAAWFSADGRSWSRVPHDGSVFGGAGAQMMYGVVAGGPGLVAVGLDNFANSDGSSDAAVWTSPDGVTWTRVTDSDGALGGPGSQQMSGVVATGSGLVAVGYDDYANPLGTDSDAAVWTSPDGVTWTRVPDIESSLGGVGFQEMWRVVVGGPGLVAIGSERDPVEGNLDAAVWTSTDGEIWARVPHQEESLGGPGYQRMNGIAAGGPGLVAVGYDQLTETGRVDAVAVVWTSTDGVEWIRHQVDESEGVPGFRGMSGVVSFGAELVAVGSDDTGEDSEAVVWISPDGVRWNRMADDEAVFGGPGSQAMGGAVSVGSLLIAIGWDDSAEDHDAAVWLGEP